MERVCALTNTLNSINESNSGAPDSLIVSAHSLTTGRQRLLKPCYTHVHNL